MEQLAKDIHSLLRSSTLSRAMAKLLYNKSYRKVVHCKDCKHFDMKLIGDGRAWVFRCTHQLGLRCPSEDNWCCFGERK